MTGTFHTTRTVLGALGVSVVVALPTYLTGALVVQMTAALGYSASSLGALGASFSAASAAGSILMGSVAQRIGWSKALRLAGLLVAGVLIAIATIVSSFLGLMTGLLLAGVANSLSSPASNYALAATVPPQHRGILFGLKQASLPGATLLGGLAVPLIAMRGGWQLAFGIAGTIALVSVLLVPRHDGGSPRGDSRQKRRRNTRELIPLMVMAFGATLGLGAAQGLAVFTVASSVDAGIGEGASGTLLAVGSAAAIGGRLMAGWLVDRFRLDLFTTITTMAGIGALGYGLLATRIPNLILVGTLVAFGLGWGWSGVFNLASVEMYPQEPAFATGISQFGVYIGAGSGPLIFGALLDGASYSAAWSVMAGLALAGALVLFIAGRLWQRSAALQSG